MKLLADFKKSATIVVILSLALQPFVNTAPTLAVTNDPVIESVSDINAEATSPDGAVVTYTLPTTTDDIDGTIPTICLPASGSLFPIGQTNVICNATDSSGNSAIPVNFDIVVQDTSPVISLNDTSPIEIEYGSTYIEPGAIWTDIVDGTGVVKNIGGDIVNTNLLEKYTIEYNHTDSAGNKADEVTRTVKVVDTTPPVLELIGDNVINVEYVAEYNDQGATCIDNGETLTTIVGGDTVDANNVGDTYVITYTCTDSSGNEAVQSEREVNIIPRIITVTADDVSRIYGETTPMPQGSELTYQIVPEGLLNPDDLSGELESTIFSLNTGAYDITQGTIEINNPNFTLNFVPGKLTIAPAKLTITAISVSKIAGKKDPALTYTMSGSMFYEDVLFGNIARPAGEAVGKYLINQGTLANNNYDISFIGAIFTIKKVPVVDAITPTKTNDTTTPDLNPDPDPDSNPASTSISTPITTTTIDTASSELIDTAVLGTKTTSEDNNTKQSINTSDGTKPADNNFFEWMLFGVYDWVWLILLAAAGSWWFFSRNRDSEK